MRVGELEPSELRARFADPGLCCEVGPFAIRVKTRLGDVARHVGFLYSQFPLLDGETLVDTEVCVRSKLPGLPWVEITADGERQYDWLKRRLAVPMVEWTLNVCVFQRPHQYFMLHAAVVERDGRAAVLTGRAGSGKSTLVAALVHRGWRLLSDEVAPVRPSDGRILPVPRAIGLKEASIEAIRRFAPQATLGRSWPGTVKGTVAHMLPPAESVARAAEPAKPAWLVFPTYDPRARAQLQPLPKARALMRAADNAFNYSVLGRLGFETLADMIDRCECYDLRCGDLEAAVTLFDELR